MKFEEFNGKELAFGTQNIRGEGLKALNHRMESRYSQFGFSPATLDDKPGKSAIRHEILTSQYNFTNKKILDIGCGFGELNLKLTQLTGEGNYIYKGVDISQSIIEEAKKHFSGINISFGYGAFLDYPFNEEFDYGILAGALNYPVKGDNYEYVHEVMKKALSLCKDGIAFDFLSDRVDYRYEHAFYYNPMKILEIAYGFSRRVMLRNDYFPFEYSVFVWNDDSFRKEDTTFIKYREESSERKNQ